MNGSPHCILADRVWDGVSDHPRSDMAVRVRDSRIEAVLPRAELAENARGVEFPGCTLLPGLIDAHVHYSQPMGPTFLAAGVTTVRDVGNDLHWILRQRERNAVEPALGPAIVCCGFLLDGPAGFWQHIARHHTDADGVRQSVREHVDAGVDQIKFYATLDLEMLKAGIAEAHRHGKTTVAHLGNVDAADAVRAGLDHIEHQTCCAPAWKDSTPEEQDELIDLLLASKTVLDPTLVVWDRVGKIYDRSFFHDKRRAWVHPQYLKIWDRYASGYLTVPYRADYQAAMPRLKRFLARAQARGVTIALGTDTPFPHLIPGFSVHDELAMYVDAGIKPVDALRSATSINARVIGRAGQVGEIKPGCDADFLIVKGDPTRDITAIENIVCVMRGGVRLEPTPTEKLQAMETRDAITTDLQTYVEFLERQVKESEAVVSTLSK